MQGVLLRDSGVEDQSCGSWVCSAGLGAGVGTG